MIFHRSVTVSLAISVALTSGLAAQTPTDLERDCDATTVTEQPVQSIPEGQRATFPPVIFAAESALVNRREFIHAITNIRRAFAEEEVAWPDSVRQRFENQTASLIRAIVRADQRSGTLDNDLFVPVEIGGGRFRLFEGADSLVFVDAPLAWRRPACWQAIAIHQIVAERNRAGYERGATVFANRVKQWEAFHASGYEPFPWERPLTAWLDRNTDNALEDLRPPRYQVILLHPGIGSTVSGSLRSWRKGDLRASPTIWWELAGLVRYNARYTGRYGASLLMAIPEEGGVGVGPMLHVSRYALAYVFRDSGEGESGRGVVLTVDLYKLLTGGPKTPKPIADVAEQQ